MAKPIIGEDSKSSISAAYSSRLPVSCAMRRVIRLTPPKTACARVPTTATVAPMLERAGEPRRIRCAMPSTAPSQKSCETQKKTAETVPDAPASSMAANRSE